MVKNRTVKQTQRAFIVSRLSNDEMVYRCECVARLQCRGSRSGTPNKESRSFAKSPAERGPRRCQDKVEYPWRCDDPGASDRESLPDQRPRSEVVYGTCRKRIVESSRRRLDSNLRNPRNA